MKEDMLVSQNLTKVKGLISIDKFGRINLPLNSGFLVGGGAPSPNDFCPLLKIRNFPNGLLSFNPLHPV